MAAASTNSPSSSSSSSSSATTRSSNPNNRKPNPISNSHSTSSNPMQSWWESISRARTRILSLSSVLSLPSLSSLADSDRPASSLLDSIDSYSAVSSALSLPSSGAGDDPLCQWLYETFQSTDPDLRLVVLSFVPFISGIYLSRIIASPSTTSVAGFESVLLSIYGSETSSRGGKPLTISIPDLSQPSLYHTPRPAPRTSAQQQMQQKPVVGILSPPLEPQVAIKSTKRACIVGVVLDCYYKKVSLMPVRSKIDFCEFAVSWAGQDCSCRYKLDDESNSSSLSNFEEDGEIGSFSGEMARLGINGIANGSCNGSPKGCRVPLPWELMQPVLKILGHCLLGPSNVQEVKDAASAAVRSVYARASHDLVPQVILASGSLIQLDKRARKAAKDETGMVVMGGMVSNPTTPSKPKKPELLLVSK